MMFVVYFVVSESLSIKKEGRAYFTLWGNYGQWVFILLTTCTVVVHLSQATLADQQWLKYLNNRKGFTNFYQVAFLNTIFSTLAASLLFLLTVQVRRGLAGSRMWSGMWALVRDVVLFFTIWGWNQTQGCLHLHVNDQTAPCPQPVGSALASGCLPAHCKFLCAVQEQAAL